MSYALIFIQSKFFVNLYGIHTVTHQKTPPVYLVQALAGETANLHRKIYKFIIWYQFDPLKPNNLTENLLKIYPLSPSGA